MCVNKSQFGHMGNPLHNIANY